ncbi:unnamed protein product [Cyprideis torosa]|uniref:Uncharacterized protein n=1 Tax=Cyprideis torosa TaxID=163714 RepID=A0A7R8ZXQ6_9CRUS|nr:unnamed protein product [Cyprideis torosa]CAG0907199.1 unnamed protein product [Cyprideis torosa]
MCHAIHKEDLSIAGRLRPSSVEMPVVFGRSSSTSSGPDIGFLLGLNSSAMDQWVLKEIRHKDDNSLWTERLILPIFKPPQEPPELPPDDSKDFSPPRPELGKLVEEVFNVLPIQIHWFDSQRKLL